MTKIVMLALVAVVVSACAATPYVNKAVPGQANVCQIGTPVGCKNFDGQFGGDPNVDAGVKK